MTPPASTNTMPTENVAPPRSRSVMDYTDVESLRSALSDLSNWKMGGNLDSDSSCSENLEDEMERLEVLRSYRILDAEREQTFERFTALASRIFDVPIALVSLVDFGRQWFMSNRGLGEVRETPRDVAFCAHTILSTEDLFVVPDATKDRRFKSNDLVTGAPHIRFYAGAPLICPEGYKLGTLCIIDTKTRLGGLGLDDKQNLRELAALVMDAMVTRRAREEVSASEKSRTIACTSHDMLTPLSGIQMNLSLLADDDKLVATMDAHEKDLLESALTSSEILANICRKSIEEFRGEVSQHRRRGRRRAKTNSPRCAGDSPAEEEGVGKVTIARLVTNIRQVMDPYPKRVPLNIDVSEYVPPVIVSDDIKLFRSATNYLTNACKVTEEGFVRLNIFTRKAVEKGNKKNMLVFECEDTGPGVDITGYSNLFKPFTSGKHDHSKMENSGLGLYSVASNITLLGGQYGFVPREERQQNSSRISRSISNDSLHLYTGDSSPPVPSTGSIFWFAVPLDVPKVSPKRFHKKKDATNSSGTGSSVKPDPDASKKVDPDNNRVVRGNDQSEIAISLDILDSIENKIEEISLNTGPVPSIVRQKCALVIDDSITIRKGIDRALVRSGFSVTQACDGMEGLRMLKKGLFDIVFCDFLMPVMDGLDCVQQYRHWEKNNHKGLRQLIIGISAHASDNDAERGLKIGMDKFLAKPVSLKTIKEICAGAEVSAASKALDNEFSSRIAAIEERNQDEDNGKDDISCSSAASTQFSSTQFCSSQPICLIAEDSSTIAKAMARIVENNGWRAVLVDNGEDALRMMKVRNWDAVFLDDMMPGLSGTSCILQFRQWEAENRVVRQSHVYFASANYTEGDCCTVHPTGFDGAMGKPLRLKDVKKILELAGGRDRHTCTLNMVVRA